jgi:hypothetical protein
MLPNFHLAVSPSLTKELCDMMSQSAFRTMAYPLQMGSASPHCPMPPPENSSVSMLDLHLSSESGVAVLVKLQGEFLYDLFTFLKSTQSTVATTSS